MSRRVSFKLRGPEERMVLQVVNALRGSEQIEIDLNRFAHSCLLEACAIIVENSRGNQSPENSRGNQENSRGNQSPEGEPDAGTDAGGTESQTNIPEGEPPESESETPTE